tara:strand:- start:89422 stop:91416 length:1995 start_codon:yes stop_codon:yes gene_type:complete
LTAKRKIFLGLLGTLVFLIGYVVYLLFIAPSTNLQSIYLIPKDAVFVVETQEPIAAWEEIRESDVWKHLQKNDYFYEMTESIHKMDTVFYSKKKLFEYFGTRSLFFSVHMYKPKQYGLFYVIDLKRIAKLKLLNTYLNTILNDDYTLSRRTYNGHEIIELYDKESRETLYLSFIKNQLIASYVHTLVEASIDEYSAPVIGRNLDFIEVKKRVGYDDMFRLYLQYSYLDEYIRYFTDTPKEWVRILSDHFLFSGFTFDLKSNNTITANGFTNMSPTTVGYLKALQKSGKAKRTIPKIAPKRTALYLSYGFDSFDEFYANFEKIQQENPVDFETYTASIAKIEKQLKINIKENFVSWVGNEMALLQLQSSVTKGKNDVALVFKANDIESAQMNLNFILRQIKKRTPVKFKQIDYEGHVINFMSIKGFFKLLVGNLFNELDKPYYTIIDDYVIFSNKPNTLKSIITDFKTKQTLDTSEDFQHFNRYFDKESSVFAYINTPVLYENMYAFVDTATKQQIEENKDFIICFPQIGFQLIPYASMFETKLVVDYQDAALVEGKDQFKDNQLFGPSISGSKVTTKNILEVATIFKVKKIYPEDLNADEYLTKYPDGNPHLKVQLKDGLKHGRYFEYYPNGVVKIKGRYRKDIQIGVWRAYDKEGGLIKRKRF